MASNSRMTDAMVALHKSPLCSSEISNCLQVMVYQRRSITHGTASACHRGDSHRSQLQKVITDVQTSGGKLCDLGKQSDSLPFPLILQNKLTEVITWTNDNKPAEAT